MSQREIISQNSHHIAPVYLLGPGLNQDLTDNRREEVKVLFDLDKFICLDDFASALVNYYQGETVEDTPLKRRKKSKKTKELNRNRSQPIYLPENILYLALQKCRSKESFWSKDGFEKLLTNNFIIHGLDDEIIFDCILKYNALSSLKIVAKCMIAVSEKYVIRILKHIISFVSLDLIKLLRTKVHTSECPVDDEIATYLSYTMMLPINKLSLGEFLKLLTSDESLVMLQFLHYLLYAVSPALCDQSLALRSFDKEINERSVMTWLDALLTAHLMSFTSSTELNDIVKDVRKTILAQVAFYQNIAQLGPYLRHIKEGKKRTQQLIGEYTVETITI